jgi:hypothetical protein
LCYIYWCKYCEKEYHLGGKTKDKPVLCKKCKSKDIEVVGIPVYDLKGVGGAMTENLVSHGYRLVSDLCSSTVDDIQKNPGIGKKTAIKIFEEVKKWYPDYKGKTIHLAIKDGKIKR